MVARAHPEGRYDWYEEPDGSRTMLDVPILIDVEIPLLTADGTPMLDDKGEQVFYKIDRPWMKRAIVAAQADWTERRYRQTVKVNHEGGERTVEPAGLFLPTRIVSGTYRGKPHAFLLANLTINRPAIWEELQNGQMPFLSPELRRVLEVPEVNAVSIMRDVEPFQRLPPLIPGNQVSAPSFAHSRLAAYLDARPIKIRRAPPITAPGPGEHAFLQSPASGVALLMDMDAIKKDDDEGKAALCAEGGEGKEPELDDKGKAFLAGFSKLFAQHYGAAPAAPAATSTAGDEVDDESVITTGDANATQAVEQADPDDKKKPTPGGASMAAPHGPAMARLEGRLVKAENAALAAKTHAAKLEGQMAAERAKVHKDTTIDAIARLLAPYGTTRAMCVAQWDRYGGEAALKAFAEGVQASGTASIGSWDGDLPVTLMGDTDPELAFIEQLPAEARGAAAKLAASHRTQSAQGVRMPQPLRPYVVDALVLMRQIPRELEHLGISADNYAAPSR